MNYLAISASRIRELMDYDSHTGILKWCVGRGRNSRCKGRVAGFLCRGRRVIRVDGALHRAARLAFLHHHGYLPNCDIDHRNQNPADDCIENLRPATRSQNCFNQSARKTNTSGFKGVSFSAQHKRWRARITVRGERIELGLFSNPAAAGLAYVHAAKHHHGEFAGVT